MAIIFDGRKLAKEKEAKLAAAVAAFKKNHGFAPRLVSILVGNNPASIKYLAIKKTVGERVGIEMEIIKLTELTEPAEVTELIEAKNRDPQVHGIMIQMPLPKAIINSQLLIINAIGPRKDVDCLTKENLELLKTGKPRFLPATTAAVMAVIGQSSGIGDTIPIQDRRMVVVGNRGFVGEPLFDYLKGQGLNVTGVDKETKNLGEITRQADILISATGQPGLIKKEMVKKDAAVIDVGYPQPDVDFDEVKNVASFITPVPGGVGPLTVISLLENVLPKYGNS